MAKMKQTARLSKSSSTRNAATNASAGGASDFRSRPRARSASHGSAGTDDPSADAGESADLEDVYFDYDYTLCNATKSPRTGVCMYDLKWTRRAQLNRNDVAPDNNPAAKTGVTGLMTFEEAIYELNTDEGPLVDAITRIQNSKEVGTAWTTFMRHILGANENNDCTVIAFNYIAAYFQMPELSAEETARLLENPRIDTLHKLLYASRGLNVNTLNTRAIQQLQSDSDEVVRECEDSVWLLAGTTEDTNFKLGHVVAVIDGNVWEGEDNVQTCSGRYLQQYRLSSVRVISLRK
jgi:hypothetical protein